MPDGVPVHERLFRTPRRLRRLAWLSEDGGVCGLGPQTPPSSLKTACEGPEALRSQRERLKATKN